MMLLSYEVKPQATERIINAATNLKVIARAGWCDNINIEAATLKGILVINAPDGNTLCYRTFSSYVACNGTKYSQAHQSLRNKEWNRVPFRGLNFMAKPRCYRCLIGLGVAKRAQSFGMKFLAFDPYLTEDKAKSLDIQIATVDEIAENPTL